MRVYEMQDKDGFGHVELFQTFIKDIEQRYGDKKIDEIHYHSQISFYYCCLYMPNECKMHAALVPGDADVDEKALAMHGVARMLVYEKKIEEALVVYEQIYALLPDHEAVIEEAAWYWFELKQWENAKEWFLKAIAVNDEFESYLEGLGRSLAQLGRFTEALLAFKKGLELCEQESYHYVYHNLIGQCYANLNDFYRALDHYTKCLDANPTYATGLNDMAALYFNQEGDITNALDYLKKAETIALEKEMPHTLQMVYMNLANLYKKLKEFDLEELYHAKFMESLGFGFTIEYDDDEEGGDDEDKNNDEDAEEEL